MKSRQTTVSPAAGPPPLPGRLPKVMTLEEAARLTNTPSVKFKRIFSLVVGVALALGAGASTAQAQGPNAVVYRVPDSILSDCSGDVAPELNAFIASVPNGRPSPYGIVPSVIEFQAGGCYRVEDKLAVTRRSHLRVDGQGATVESHDVDDSGLQPAWEVSFSRYVFFEDMIVVGDNPNPSHFSGPPREWSPGFLFGGSHDVGVDRVEVHNVYGDGVMFSPKWDGRTPVQTYNGHVRDSVVDGSGRMCLAFTGGHDITWEKNVLRNCPWVFDLELEWARVGFGIENVTIRDNHTGLYRLVWLANGGACGKHDNIVVEDNVMDRSGPTSWAPVTVQNPIGCSPRTDYIVRGNTFRIPGWGSADWGTHLQGTQGAVLDGNTYIYERGLMDNNYLARLLRSHGVSITNNTMVRGWRLVKNLRNSSWTQSGNNCGTIRCR